MSTELENIYESLFLYCRDSDFAGFDPFDGLSSSVFRFTQLYRLRTGRLFWQQAIKRAPFNIRPLVGVSKGQNSKALALFALAELARYRTLKSSRHKENVIDLLARLSDLAISGKNHSLSFGYNFDWQSRFFFAPQGTPAIVPTAFAQQALVEAYEAFGESDYLDKAIAICEFITSELQRTCETGDEVCFSYTPGDSTCVYNASLLASECLTRVGAMTGNAMYLDLAARAARYVTRRQRDDGAWRYGESDKQRWVDNFHTAYVLLSLKRISQLVPAIAAETEDALERGKRYWLENFFRSDGAPKYYDNSVYPIDIHSAAAAIVASCELGMPDLARRTADWTIANMYDGHGLFYYQKRKSYTINTTFMRWGQAWMAYALARLIEAETGSKT